MKKFLIFLFIFCGMIASLNAMESPLTPRSARIEQLQEQVGNLQNAVVVLLQERNSNSARVADLERDMVPLLQERRSRLEMASRLAQLQAQQNSTYQRVRDGAFYIMYTSQGLVSRYYIQLYINRYAEKIKDHHPKVATVLVGTSAEVATIAAGAGTYATQLMIEKAGCDPLERLAEFKNKLGNNANQILTGIKKIREVMVEVLSPDLPVLPPECALNLSSSEENNSMQVEMPTSKKIIVIGLMGTLAGASTGWFSAKYKWRIVL